MGGREVGVRERRDLIKEPLSATVSAQLWGILSKSVTQACLERFTLATLLGLDWRTGIEDKGTSQEATAVI